MLVIALSSSEQYVAGAYLVFLALVLVYLAIMAAKLSRLEREVVELAELDERRNAVPEERVREPV
ncbi:hypothetical protein BH20ACT17_BH20ACT17_19960 [soil metagenome]|jgi:hypothetical protein